MVAVEVLLILFIADLLQSVHLGWIILAALLSLPCIFLVCTIWEKISFTVLIWVVVMIGTSLSFRHRDPGLLATSEAVDLQVLVKLAIFAGCGLYVMYRTALWPRQLVKAISTSPLKWMFAYGLMALMSTAYSSFRSLTLVSSLQFMIVLALLGVAIVIDNLPARRILNVTLLVLLAIESAVCVLYFVAPDLAIMVQWPNLRRLGGLLIHPNGLAVVAAVLSVVALCRVVVANRWSRRLLYFGILLVSVMTLIATQGRAAFVAWLLSSLCICVLLRSLTQKYFLLLGAMSTILVIIFVPEVLVLVTKVFTRGEDITTLTGRTTVWKYVLSLAREPLPFLLGFGYGTPRLSLLTQLPGSWTHTHNAFLEALMGLGIFGVMFLVASFTSAGLFLLRRMRGSTGEDFSLCVELLGVLVVLFVTSMTSGSMGGRVNLSLLIYLGILACCVRIKVSGKADHV